MDELAKTAPDRVLAQVPLKIAVDANYRSVTVADLASAINHAAWWIEDQIGRSQQFTTLAYAGPQDLRIFTLIVGAIKTGHKVSLTF